LKTLKISKTFENLEHLENRRKPRKLDDPTKFKSECNKVVKAAEETVEKFDAKQFEKMVEKLKKIVAEAKNAHSDVEEMKGETAETGSSGEPAAVEIVNIRMKRRSL